MMPRAWFRFAVAPSFSQTRWPPGTRDRLRLPYGSLTFRTGSRWVEQASVQSCSSFATVHALAAEVDAPPKPHPIHIVLGSILPLRQIRHVPIGGSVRAHLAAFGWCGGIRVNRLHGLVVFLSARLQTSQRCGRDMDCRDRRPRVALSEQICCRAVGVALERQVVQAVDAERPALQGDGGPSHSGVKCGGCTGGCVQSYSLASTASTLPESGAPQLRSAHLAI